VAWQAQLSPTAHPKYLDEMEVLGYKAFPLQTIGAHQMVGFRPAEIEEAVAAAGMA
jgi:hypothetical protein